MSNAKDGRFVEAPFVHPNLGLLVPFRVAASGNSGWLSTEDINHLAGPLNVHAFYETALTGTHNDIAYVQRAPGAAAVSIAYVVSGNNTALSIGVVGNAITVNVATGSGGAATSTAAQVLAALKATPAAWALVHAELAPSNDGTGVVTALSAQNLAGPTGSSPTLDVTVETTVDGTNALAAGTAYTQVTALAGSGACKVFGPLWTTARAKWTLGGTGSPVFWISLPLQSRAVR